MKKILLLSLVLTLPIMCYAQKKMYVYKPKEVKYVATNFLDGKTICLRVKDVRVIAPGSKINCTFDELSLAIKGALKKTYPKAKFIDCENDSIPMLSISINVKSYDASFYAGMWHAQAKYIVTTNNNGLQKKEEIEQLNNFFNVLGGATAKTNLSKCFNNLNLKLFDMINNVFEE